MTAASAVVIVGPVCLWTGFWMGKWSRVAAPTPTTLNLTPMIDLDAPTVKRRSRSNWRYW